VADLPRCFAAMSLPLPDDALAAAAAACRCAAQAEEARAAPGPEDDAAYASACGPAGSLPVPRSAFYSLHGTLLAGHTQHAARLFEALAGRAEGRPLGKLEFRAAMADILQDRYVPAFDLDAMCRAREDHLTHGQGQGGVLPPLTLVCDEDIALLFALYDINGDGCVAAAELEAMNQIILNTHADGIMPLSLQVAATLIHKLTRARMPSPLSLFQR
jgi:hypothetical protein